MQIQLLPKPEAVPANQKPIDINHLSKAGLLIKFLDKNNNQKTFLVPGQNLADVALTEFRLTKLKTKTISSSITMVICYQKAS